MKLYVAASNKYQVFFRSSYRSSFEQTTWKTEERVRSPTAEAKTASTRREAYIEGYLFQRGSGLSMEHRSIECHVEY